MGHSLPHLGFPLFRRYLQQIMGIRAVACQEKPFHRIPLPVQVLPQFPEFRRAAGKAVDQQHPFAVLPLPEIRFRALEHPHRLLPHSKNGITLPGNATVKCVNVL